MNVLRRRFVTGAALIGVAAAVAPAASAHVTFTAAMSPTTIHYPQTREIEYRLTMTTGADPERFSVGLRTPVYGGLLGSPVTPAGPPTLTGPGTIVSYREGRGRFAPAGVDPCTRGYEERLDTVELALPASSTAMLVARHRTGRAAPWPDTDYRLAFVVRGMSGGGPGRVETVRPPPPRLVGKTGVRFRLLVRPWNPPSGGRVRVVVRPTPGLHGQRIVLRTAVVPPAPGLFIEGPHYPQDFRPPRTLAVLRVERGEARFRWRPRLRTYHDVWVVYRSQDSDLVSDASCHRTIVVE